MALTMFLSLLFWHLRSLRLSCSTYSFHSSIVTVKESGNGRFRRCRNALELACHNDHRQRLARVNLASNRDASIMKIGQLVRFLTGLNINDITLGPLRRLSSNVKSFRPILPGWLQSCRLLVLIFGELAVSHRRSSDSSRCVRGSAHESGNNSGCKSLAY